MAEIGRITNKLAVAGLTGILLLVGMVANQSSIVNEASTVATAVEEQLTVIQEISCNVRQAAQRTQQVFANFTDVQRGARETGSVRSKDLAAAQTASSDGDRLKLAIGKFIHSVRAA